MSAITSGVERTIKGLFNVVGWLLQSIIGVLQAAFGAVEGVIFAALSIITGTINTAVHIVTGTLKSVTNLLGNTITFIGGNILGISVLVIGFLLYQNYKKSNPTWKIKTR